MKKITGFVSLLLALGLSAGCGSANVVTSNGAKDENSQNSIGQSTTQQESSKEDKSQQGEGVAEGDAALSLDGLEMKGNIKVSTYEDDEYLSAAAKAFQAKYPDVHIDVEVFAPISKEYTADGGIISSSNEDPNLSVDKYITQLNTAFMNQSASDMINLGGLPFYKYAEQGYLYDLKNTVNGKDGLSSDEYYLNVLEAMQYNEGYYNMPFTFNVTSMGVIKPIFNEAGMSPAELTNETWNLENMVDLAKKIEEKTGKKYTLSLYGIGQVFMETLRAGGNPFVDVANKKVSFDSQEFKQLLEEFKTAADEGYISDDGKNELFCDNVGLGQIYFNDTYCKPAWDDYCVAWKPYTNSEGAIATLPYCNYGLNAASSQKELCWAFMKFLYSKEMQTDASCYGRRMNKAAEAQFVEDEVDYLIDSEEMQFTGSREEAIEEYSKFDESCIEKVKGYDLLEASVQETIWEEVKAYFDGNKSADEVASTLQNKVNVMFNE